MSMFSDRPSDHRAGDADGSAEHGGHDPGESGDDAGSGPGSRRRSTPPVTARAVGVMASVMVGAFVVAGAIAGMVWSRLGLSAGQVEMVMGEDGPIFRNEFDAGQVVAMDGWFAVLGLIAGAVVGSVLFVVFRGNGPWATLCLTVASAIGAVVAFGVGALAANDQVIVAWEPRAEIGAPLSAPLTVHAYGVLLAWPIATLVGIAVLAWLGSPEQREKNPI